MAIANSTTKIQPWQHKASGLWCITRKGRRYYLGRTETEAVERAARYKNSISRGLPIPEIGNDPDGEDDTAPTVKNVTLAFLQAQKRRCDSKELAQRSLTEYARSCRDFTEFVGAEMMTADLKPEHFAEYRADVSNRRNLVSVGNEVTRIKTIFKWAYENDVLPLPIKFGTDFKRPKKSDVRNYKRGQEPRTFTQQEIKLLLSELGVHERAMALLGINAGFGNKDCSTLLLKEVNFEAGEISAIRPKTGEARFATLWPETIAALKLSLKFRHQPKTSDAKNCFFVTFEGDVYVQDSSGKSINDMVNIRTTAALQRVKIHEAKKSFYALRHTFRTVADELGDKIAADWIMGHVRDGIEQTYIHKAPKKRIKKITDHVRQWLFGEVAKMNRAESKEAVRLIEKAVCLFESGKTFAQCYPILREIEPLLTKCLGKTTWPRLLVSWRDGQQLWEVATSVSDIDNYHSGFFSSEELRSASDEDLALLHSEILLALKQWKIEIAAITGDTKRDTKKKKSGKKRQITKEAVKCGEYVRKALQLDSSKPRIMAVTEYVNEHGGSVEGLDKRLGDNKQLYEPRDT